MSVTKGEGAFQPAIVLPLRLLRFGPPVFWKPPFPNPGCRQTFPSLFKSVHQRCLQYTTVHSEKKIFIPHYSKLYSTRLAIGISCKFHLDRIREFQPRNFFGNFSYHMYLSLQRESYEIIDQTWTMCIYLLIRSCFLLVDCVRFFTDVEKSTFFL